MTENRKMRIGWPGPALLAGCVFCLIAGLMVLPPLLNRKPNRANRFERIRPPSVAIDRSASDRIFDRLPLSFIRNEGQADRQARYYARTRGYTLWLTGNGLTFDRVIEGGQSESAGPGSRLKNGFGACERDVSRLEFIGSNPNPAISGAGEQAHRVNVFRGREPAAWKTGIRTYDRVEYKSVYEGIDLRVYGAESRIEYDWMVKPGADPGRIRFKYEGIKKAEVTSEGELRVETDFGELRHSRPVSFQEIDGRRITIDVVFKRLAENEYGFEAGLYDSAHPLTIDPLIYSTYLGGSTSNESAGTIAVDGQGNAYIAGSTYSTDFPITAEAYQTARNFPPDAFITKLRADGSGLIYSTFLGGNNVDSVNDLAVDGAGNVLMLGNTVSSDFPTTFGAYDRIHNGTRDAFIAKLNATGTELIFSTYLGGNDDEYPKAMTMDGEGNSYLTGSVDSTNFPTTAGAFDRSLSGSDDVFVTKLNSAGSALIYSTFLGGGEGETGMDIAVDGAGIVYLTGTTDSADYPTTVDATSPALKGSTDAFLTKLNASGSALAYSSYLGGSLSEVGERIVVSGGNVYVVGSTSSSDFPVTSGALDTTYNQGYDLFVMKFSALNAEPTWSTFLGGSNNEESRGLALEGSGGVCLTGYTLSSDFPTTVGAFDASANGNRDVFIVRLDSATSSLLYSSYIGGSNWDESFSLALDGKGNAFLTGYTFSADFPTTAGAWDPSYNAQADVFIVKIKIGPGGKANLLGTWDGQGVYFRDSTTGDWNRLASPADMIAAGDLTGDGIDDLIGIWSGQAGVWIRSSADGDWSYLSSPARHIASGDMNGDGRADFLGTWDGQGVFYRNSISGAWTMMATPATMITAGDLDGDGTNDLIGIWPSQAGVWVKYSQTESWAYLSTAVTDLSAGDMNGDGRADLIGTWDGQGVFYRNSLTGAWVMMATPASQITAGDLDGDGTDDLIGIWPTQAGVWVKYSKTLTWDFVGSSARDIAAGRMASGAWTSSAEGPSIFSAIFGNRPEGAAGGGFNDLSPFSPWGGRFEYRRENQLIPSPPDSIGHFGRPRIPGPGEPGFNPIWQDNLIPGQGK